MFCKKCGKEVDSEAEICVECGTKIGTGNEFCQHCGGKVDPNAEVCLKCGYSLKINENSSEKSKVVAGLLGIFVGSLGIHNFYLGFSSKGILQVILTIAGLATCGITSIIAEIWGLIEGIMILTNKAPVDSEGKILKS
ncbi:MAG: TM2 domain-containing protein [Erysipelotrichaceae bacterium]